MPDHEVLEHRVRVTARLPRAAFLALILALPRLAWSQPVQTAAPAQSAAQRETARAWVLEGRRLFAEKDYAAALERYLAAYQLMRVPTVGIEVARAQQALGKWVEANATAVEVVNLPRAEQEPEVFSAAREQARELWRGLTPRVPAVQLNVTPRAAGALIRIDGEEMPRWSSSTSFKLNPGKHELHVRAPGYRTETRTIVLAEKENPTLSIALTVDPLASSPSPPTSPEGAASRQASEGSEEASPGSAARTRGYVAVSVAGVAAIVGGVTGVLAFHEKPSCPANVCAPAQRDEADASRRYGNVATASFGIGLVAGAYGLWELLAHAAPSPAAASQAPPPAQLLLVRAGGVLQMSGAF